MRGASSGRDGPELHRAAEDSRDQSYFLYRTTREQLDFLRFPLGDLAKDETRRACPSVSLCPWRKSRTARTSASCRRAPMPRSSRSCGPAPPSPATSSIEAGRVLGRHHGIIHFTVGQRKGLGIAAAEPLYVLRLEPESRRVVVGPRAALAAERVGYRRVNWLAEAPPRAGLRCQVKLRSAQPPVRGDAAS